MAPRMITLSGLRRIDPGLSLPRETTAAAKLADGLLANKQALVSASTPEQVEQVVAQAWGRTMADLAIPRDPHVTLTSSAIIGGAPGAALIIPEVDLFKTAAGGVGAWSIRTNLMRDDEVLRPVLIHSIGATVGLKSGSPGDDLMSLSGYWLELRRAKQIIAEIPLLTAATCIVYGDRSATAVSHGVSLSSASGGGYELEGHGSVYIPRSDSALQLWVRNPFGLGLAAPPAGVEAMMSLSIFIDGEALEG